MARLIDADAIPYEEHYVPDGDTQWEYKKELCVLKPAIDKMPTVDAVEVVRCKDCKHRVIGFGGSEYICGNPYFGMASGVELKDNDFCSYGERRTE